MTTSTQPGQLDPSLVQALQSSQLRSNSRASLPAKLHRFSQPLPVAARVAEAYHAQHDQQPRGQQQGYVQWPVAPVQLVVPPEIPREVTHEMGSEEDVHTGSSIFDEPLQSQAGVMLATRPARGTLNRELGPVWHEADVCIGAALPCRRSVGFGRRHVVPRLDLSPLPVDEVGRENSSDSEDTTQHNELVAQLSAAQDEATSLRIALASATRNATRADQEAEDLRKEMAALMEETSTVLVAARINSREVRLSEAPQFSSIHTPAATSPPLPACQFSPAFTPVILAEMAATREASCKAQSDVEALRAELAMLNAQFRSSGAHGRQS